MIESMTILFTGTLSFFFIPIFLALMAIGYLMRLFK